jgi:hypothetical protein
MKSKTRIITTLKCICGRRLVIEEMPDVTLFGCRACQCYVVATNSKIKPYSYGNVFNWKKLMEDLYAAYLEAREYICSR